MVCQLLILLVRTKKTVVEITVLARVYSYEVASTLVLKHHLNYHFFLSWLKLDELIEIFLLDPVQLIDILYFAVYCFLDQSMKLMCCLGIILLLLLKMHLVVWLCHTNKVESVFDQIGFDFEIKWRLKCQRWRKIDLHEPWIQVIIKQNIISV